MALLRAFLFASPVLAIDNGLGLTPPMGWRGWLFFYTVPSQAKYDRILSGMVSRNRSVHGKPTSLRDLGYTDVGLDNGWQNRSGDKYVYHDDGGNPMVNQQRFPNMTNMTAYAHSLGLTMSWYGNNCQSPEKEAPREMYEGDAATAVRFGWDGYKLDSCGAEKDITLLANLFNASGKPMLIENCHVGLPNETWCPMNFYRTSPDISPGYAPAIKNVRTTEKWAKSGLSRPGCWAYPDMVTVGSDHGGMTSAESRTHFGLWCITSSPLILTLDVNNATLMDEHWPVISNTFAIAVNQAWAGHSGSPYNQSNVTVDLTKWVRNIPAWQHFYKPLSDGCVAVMLVNHGNTTRSDTLYFEDVPGLNCSRCHVYDVWSQQYTGWSTGTFEADIGSHDSVLLVIDRHDSCKAPFAALAYTGRAG